MHQNISTYEAIKLLKEDDNADWSWSGAEALVGYLEDLEDSLDESIAFDRVAIRCEYSEYSSALEAAQDYGFILEDDEDDENDEDDDVESSAINYLEDRTTVIKFEGGVIIQQF
jgi:hypothetical protein